MKKYVKPDLYFESFQLNQHIAACGYDLNLSDVASCESSGDTHGIYTDFGDIKFFASENGECMREPEIFCFTNGVVTDDQFKVLHS